MSAFRVLLDDQDTCAFTAMVLGNLAKHNEQVANDAIDCGALDLLLAKLEEGGKIGSQVIAPISIFLQWDEGRKKASSKGIQNLLSPYVKSSPEAISILQLF